MSAQKIDVHYVDHSLPGKLVVEWCSTALKIKHYRAKPLAHCTSFASKAEALQLAVLCMLCMQMH